MIGRYQYNQNRVLVDSKLKTPNFQDEIVNVIDRDLFLTEKQTQYNQTNLILKARKTDVGQ